MRKTRAEGTGQSRKAGSLDQVVVMRLSAGVSRAGKGDEPWELSDRVMQIVDVGMRCASSQWRAKLVIPAAPG